MPRLTKIAEKAREQEAMKQRVKDVSESSATTGEKIVIAETGDVSGSSAAGEKLVELGSDAKGVKIVEKIVYRYVRKDPNTRLDTNFNVRMPSSYLNLLKRKFGERGATAFCRVAILEKMAKEFSRDELDSLNFSNLLEEQKQNLNRNL
ncbi:MAG: hypothetical protein ACTSRF_10030 [Candidatus Freyarchaeota archaeon]